MCSLDLSRIDSLPKFDAVRNAAQNLMSARQNCQNLNEKEQQKKDASTKVRQLVTTLRYTFDFVEIDMEGKNLSDLTKTKEYVIQEIQSVVKKHLWNDDDAVNARYYEFCQQIAAWAYDKFDSDFINEIKEINPEDIATAGKLYCAAREDLSDVREARRRYDRAVAGFVRKNFFKEPLESHSRILATISEVLKANSYLEKQTLRLAKRMPELFERVDFVRYKQEAAEIKKKEESEITMALSKLAQKQASLLKRLRWNNESYAKSRWNEDLYMPEFRQRIDKFAKEIYRLEEESIPLLNRKAALLSAGITNVTEQAFEQSVNNINELAISHKHRRKKYFKRHPRHVKIEKKRIG